LDSAFAIQCDGKIAVAGLQQKRFCKMKCFRKVQFPKLASIALAMLTACISSPEVLASDVVRSPIRHLIVIVGENHSFDNLFDAYRPDPKSGQSLRNLLSQGIINSDGTPGPHFSSAQQWQAIVEGKYSIAPGRAAPYARLPRPNTNAFGQPPGLPDARFPADLPDGLIPTQQVHGLSALIYR
jgi:phospholipase C